MAETVVIRGIDPLLFRDGRPFSNVEGALAAQTLPVPLPGTIAGFLRTRIGEAEKWDWKSDGPERARRIAVRGPILRRNSVPLFSAPADAVVHGDDDGKTLKVMALRPVALPEESGCDLPHPGLLPLQVAESAKAKNGYAFWTDEEIYRWLASPDGAGFDAPQDIRGLPREERVQVAIDPATGTAREGMLFTVGLLGFEEYPPHKTDRAGAAGTPALWSLLARVESDARIAGAGLLGGEQRLAAIERPESEAWPTCPESLTRALAEARFARMVLATPALFAGGWKPGWLNEDLSGCPPGLGVRLRLVSAAVKRREAVSGWDYEKRGPKAVRWMAPAGSVYFFEVIDEQPGIKLDSAWLTAVSDDIQDRRDGYGLSLWGVWGGLKKEVRGT